eukprot:TRINITY_DN27312_c0_g1_i1.p1 TRINITY_DN27312_c0_g1~~TRINITY_DN27312_c0_g1_i1.p1  ORF type:complete len:181 (+),score=19.93 TRINITY_DN27312_c0_g1_i1:36-545(+)
MQQAPTSPSWLGGLVYGSEAEVKGQRAVCELLDEYSIMKEELRRCQIEVEILKEGRERDRVKIEQLTGLLQDSVRVRDSPGKTIFDMVTVPSAVPPVLDLLPRRAPRACTLNFSEALLTLANETSTPITATFNIPCAPQTHTVPPYTSLPLPFPPTVIRNCTITSTAVV